MEWVRDFIHQHTSQLTDGQFFGFGLLFILLGSALLLCAIEAIIIWRTDSKLKRRLKAMPHGGLYDPKRMVPISDRIDSYGNVICGVCGDEVAYCGRRHTR